MHRYIETILHIIIYIYRYIIIYNTISKTKVCITVRPSVRLSEYLKTSILEAKQKSITIAIYCID